MRVAFVAGETGGLYVGMYEALLEMRTTRYVLRSSTSKWIVWARVWATPSLSTGIGAPEATGNQRFVSAWTSTT